MITEDAIRQNVYQHILKAANRRLEQAIPGSSEGAFARLSLVAVLNLLFLIREAQSWRPFALCATSAFRLTTVRLQTSVGRAFALS